MISLVQRYSINTAGRDFVCGDVHGCYQTLEALLAKVHFNAGVDRLFSVGDLVDRGPESLRCLMMTRYPWFHAIRGNHEEFARRWFEEDEKTYRHNGGDWFLALPDSVKQSVGILVNALPVAIEIATPWGTVGLAHAGVKGTWQEHCAAWENVGGLSKTVLQKLYHRTLWSRSKITNHDESMVEGVDLVVVGHSRVPRPGALGNVLYLDTGVDILTASVPPLWPSTYRPHLTLLELNDPLGKVLHTQERLDAMPEPVEARP